MSLILAHYAKIVAVLAHAALVGGASSHWLLSRGQHAPQEVNGYLRAFFALSTGLALNIAALFALGIGAMLSPLPVAVAMAAMAGGASLYLLRVVRARSHAPGPRAGAAWRWLPHALVVAALLVIVESHAIRAPGFWDDTSYHLPYARHYVEQHGISLQPYLRFPLFPHNMNLLFAMGLMFGDVTLAQGMATVPLFVIALGLIGAGLHYLGSVIPGLVASALLMRIGPVSETLGYAYVDNGLMLFCWASGLALMLWFDSGRRRNGWLELSGLLAGTAAGVKLFGAVWAMLLGLYLLAGSRRWRPALAFAAIVALFGGGWYLHSLFVSGDPVHPAGGNVFGHFLWNAQDLLSQRQEQGTHGVGKSLLMFWPALVKAEIALLLPAFLAFLFWRPRERAVKGLYLLFLVYFVFWFFVAQVGRYLAPVLGVGGFLAGYSVYRFGIERLARRSIARWPWLRAEPVRCFAYALLLLSLAVTPFGASIERLRHWDATLASRSGYLTFQAANDAIDRYGPRLIQVGFENGVYFFKGLAIGDWFGPGRYSQFIECGQTCKLVPPARMAERMAAFDARMLAVNTKRFEVDLAAYQDWFHAQRQPDGGVLFTLERTPRGAREPAAR